jgi:putative membrane protein
MSEVKDKHQQQILFEEECLTTKQGNLLPQLDQVIVDNVDWQEEVELVDAQEETLPSTKPRWLWRVIGALFSVIVIAETVSFFQAGFAQSPILAAFYGVLLLCLTMIVGTTAVREISGLRQFKKQQKQQQTAKSILTQETTVDAKALCQRISSNLPCDLMSEHDEKWQNILQDEYNDVEIIQLYSREVLAKVDDKALAEVAKFSTESVVLVALSPIALVDMMLVFWRNFRMINKISSLYGLKIGYWSRLKLIKQIFINMAYAGASELVVDLGADLLGADLLGKLSSRMAQGLGAGMLTSRLGLKTIALCRPIPLEDNAIKMKHVRKEIVNQVKVLLLAKPKSQ